MDDKIETMTRDEVQAAYWHEEAAARRRIEKAREVTT